MDDIIKKYPNDVKIVFKNAPRGNPDDSNTKYTTALYAVAAGRQGKFLEMHHKLFDNFSELRKNPDLPLQLAAELGLDVQQLKADFNSSEVRDLVKDALVSDGVEEIFKLGEKDGGEIDIFDDDYLAKLEVIKQPNTKLQLLQQMLAKAIGEFKKTNKVNYNF